MNSCTSVVEKGQSLLAAFVDGESQLSKEVNTYIQ